MQNRLSLTSILSTVGLLLVFAAPGWVRAGPPEGSLFIVGSPLEGETVTTGNDISDADGLGEFRYRWFLDGTVVMGADSASFVLDDLAVGQTLMVEVQYTDGLGNRERVRSAPVGPVRPAGTTLAYQKRVFFFNPASNPVQESLLRLSNPNGADAEVEILGFDDAGVPGGVATLSISAQASMQIRAVELEQGSVVKGIVGGLGDGAGKWQLKVNSSVPLAVMSLVRVPGDDLANMSGVAPLLSTAAHTVLYVQGDPDASDETVLRLVNRTAEVNALTVSARDSIGELAPGGEISAVLAPYQAINVNTGDLISGNPDKGIIGSLELDPEVHTIEVRAERNLAVQGLLRSATGVLSNVSEVAPRAANDDNADRLQVTVNPVGEGQASTVRIVSLAEAGDILVLSGIDDAGDRAGSHVLELEGRGTVMLDAADLEQGGSDPRLIPGFSGPFGDGEGRWQVTVSASGFLSSSHVEAQSLVATPDGSQANLSAVAPQPSRFEAQVWVLNPASNDSQKSVLRLINREDRTGAVLIVAFDDAGQPAPGGGALLNIPARAAIELSAVDLEQGNFAKGLLGALGDGTGKWRLSLSAEVAILAQSLIESQQGGLTNVSLPVR